jgi:hypothetical protein
LLGVPEDDASFVEAASGIEVARVDLPRESQRFQTAIAVAGADIPRNTDRSNVWTERFEPLASVTKTVTILDRYAVIRLLEGNGQGLEWFMQRLDQSGPVNIHLIAQDKCIEGAEKYFDGRRH